MQVPPSGPSNYPRYNGGPSAVPPGPAQVRFEAISEAFSLMREDWGTWIVAALIIFLLSIGISYPVSMFVNLLVTGKTAGPVWGDPRLGPVSAIEGLISNGLNYCFLAGMYGMCLRRLRGEPYSFADIFVGLPRLLTFLGAGFLVGVITSLGLMLCIIPGLFLAGALAFTPLIILDQKTGAIEAIQLSYASLSKYGFGMFALLFVTGILVLAGLLGCCVGIIFVMPIYFFVVAIHYHAFFPPQGGPEVVPSGAPQYSV